MNHELSEYTLIEYYNQQHMLPSIPDALRNELHLFLGLRIVESERTVD